MQQIILAFVTGLTTGGLSCLAVQGGLLASSLANQFEREILPAQRRKKNKSGNINRSQTVVAILLFLGAKLVAYMILGALLGLVGSVLALNSTTRAILLIAVGIFMIGNALRMLNVHPIFRYFLIQPPRFITRYIRRTAKNGLDLFMPLFLGALTVFIPCGVTQAMMAVAISSGSAAMGAALMGSFIFGTSFVFFIVAYMTTQIGARLDALFTRFVAIVVLVLGLVSINTGLNLAGTPIIEPEMVPVLSSVNNQSVSIQASSTLVLEARNNGYYPRKLFALAGTPVTLNVVTQDNFSCSRDFVIPALNYETLLPETGTVPISIPAQSAGTRLFFTCSMGMYTGQIFFE